MCSFSFLLSLSLLPHVSRQQDTTFHSLQFTLSRLFSTLVRLSLERISATTQQTAKNPKSVNLPWIGDGCGVWERVKCGTELGSFIRFHLTWIRLSRSANYIISHLLGRWTGKWKPQDFSLYSWHSLKLNQASFSLSLLPACNPFFFILECVQLIWMCPMAPVTHKLFILHIKCWQRDGGVEEQERNEITFGALSESSKREKCLSQNTIKCFN